MEAIIWSSEMRIHTFLYIGTVRTEVLQDPATSVFRAHNALLYHKYGDAEVTRSTEMLVPIYQAIRRQC